MFLQIMRLGTGFGCVSRLVTHAFSILHSKAFEGLFPLQCVICRRITLPAYSIYLFSREINLRLQWLQATFASLCYCLSYFLTSCNIVRQSAVQLLDAYLVDGSSYFSAFLGVNKFLGSAPRKPLFIQSSFETMFHRRSVLAFSIVE